jgi:hypothetical protein
MAWPSLQFHSRAADGLRIADFIPFTFRISSNVLKPKVLLMSRACLHIPQSAFRNPHFLPRNPHFI